MTLNKRNLDGITHELLCEILHYDECTGHFTWIKSYNNRIKVGSIAGYPNNYGYVIIEILGKAYRAHRLAWFYKKGKWPTVQIDHKDTIKFHNHWDNLREATNGQNQLNVPGRLNKTSEFKGVCWHRNTGKWNAQIRHNGKVRNLGYYTCELEASKAYQEAAKKLHGEFYYETKRGVTTPEYT